MSTPIYLKQWRERNKEKLKAIRARYYYSNRDFILEEYGYRLMADDPRARGPFDPEPLRNKMIQIETTRLGPFRGLKSFMFDFNDSLVEELPMINPTKNSLPLSVSVNPSFPVNSLIESDNFFTDIFSIIGSSSIKCAISLNVIYSN